MKATRLMVLTGILPLAWMLAGCGPSAGDRAAEQKRLKLEERARRDGQKANEAITNMNKRLGRKPPELDLGIAMQTQTPAAANQSEQP